MTDGVVLEDVSPYGTMQAVVEADANAVYLYLVGGSAPESVRSVWVRNLAPAPKSLSRAAMERGEPPLNPAAFCSAAGPGARPKSDELSVTWFAEGNGVYLSERGRVVAIVPPWSGMDGHTGYAVEASQPGPLAWPLTEDNELLARFERDRAFWAAWSDGNPWPEMQSSAISALEAVFGQHSKYYGIDGGQWPPRGLLRFEGPTGVVLATVGMSIAPQPNVELAVEDPSGLRRVELATVLPAQTSEAQVTAVARYLSGQAAYPWARETWLGPGHTIPCDAWPDAGFSFALLTDQVKRVPLPNLPSSFGDPVSLLWFVPISEAERALAERDGGDAVLARIPAERRP
ncbi:MAG: suppressor of fused domain protein [Myxococcota bacterium]